MDKDKEMAYDRETMAVNVAINQSEGWHKGYREAVGDLVDAVLEYWQATDDGPQESLLRALVDMGGVLEQKRQTWERNVDKAREKGYSKNYESLHPGVYAWTKGEKDGGLAEGEG